MKFTLKVHVLGAVKSLPWNSLLLNQLSAKVKHLALIHQNWGFQHHLNAPWNIIKYQARKNFLPKQEFFERTQRILHCFLWIYVWFAVLEIVIICIIQVLLDSTLWLKCIVPWDEFLKPTRTSFYLVIKILVSLLQAGHAALPHQRSMLSCGDEHWTFLEFVMPLLQSCFERPYSFGDIRNHSFSRVICVGDDERPFPIQRVCLPGWNISVLTWEQFWIQDSII